MRLHPVCHSRKSTVPARGVGEAQMCSCFTVMKKYIFFFLCLFCFCCIKVVIQVLSVFCCFFFHQNIHDEALSLLVSHLWSRSLGTDPKNRSADTCGQNKLDVAAPQGSGWKAGSPSGLGEELSSLGGVSWGSANISIEIGISRRDVPGIFHRELAPRKTQDMLEELCLRWPGDPKGPARGGGVTRARLSAETVAPPTNLPMLQQKKREENQGATLSATIWSCCCHLVCHELTSDVTSTFDT